MSDPTQLRPPSRLINIPAGTQLVEDADEEIADLYMALAGLPSESGLGYLDTSKAILDLEMEIKAPTIDSKTPTSAKGPGRKARKTVAKSGQTDRILSIPVTIHQDLGMLKGRKGDTGSVLWRSSWYLAQHLLCQFHFPSNDSIAALFHRERLASSRVLELGSGTGMLAVLLSALCAEYTATDLYDNLRLVSRNIEINRKLHDRPPADKNVKLEELDWISVSSKDRRLDGYDLIIAIDCIYNEYLVKPFVDTLSMLCARGNPTIVLVVVELRSADVLTVFMEEWLSREDWQIVRLPSESLGLWDGHPGRWVGWMGWRK